MSCPHAHDDAAYVLGALSPADRLDFERHLAGCEGCTRAVRELAGLPALLGSIDPGILEHPPADEAVPVTLLPVLVREVRHFRRRRTGVAVGLAAAVAIVVAVVAPLAVLQFRDDGRAAPSGPPSSTSTADTGVETRTMQALGDAPVRASLTLEQVTWGTRLGLTCTYDPASVEYSLPPRVDYLLYVRTRGGSAERVGSWRSVAGVTMRLEAGTAVDRDEIESVEVRTADGRVVLSVAT